MAGRRISRLILSDVERSLLEQFVREGEERECERARIIIYRADGLSQEETARKLGCSSKRVSRWTTRFRRLGIESLGLSSSRLSTRHVLETLGHSPNQEPGERVSIRQVAQAASVSPMTVSRVFQSHPNVRPELRTRVIEAARQCGYCPDPELKKLMAHLRKRKVSRLRGIICSLEARTWLPEGGYYFRSLIAGAKKGAESLGYAWDVFSLEEFLEKPREHFRIWRNRGVEGILIAPAPHTLRKHCLPPDASWRQFSVLAATYSIPSPTFHRVAPNHFKNMTLLCETLSGLGYRRIGLAIPDNLDRRLFHHFSGSFLAYHHARALEATPIFLYGNPRRVGDLRDWFKQEKPDALIVNSGRNGLKIAEELNLRIPGPVAIAAVALPEGLTAGMDELPEQIGMLAADRLANMIVHRQMGLPERPTVIMMEGVWQGGLSAPGGRSPSPER